MGARVIQRTDVFYYIYRIVCISGGAKDKIADVFLQNSEFCKISMCKILSNGKIFVAGLLRLQEKIIQIATSFLTVPVSVYVNSQNCRTWSAGNPHVWYHLVFTLLKQDCHVNGPTFFQDTKNALRYRGMLLEPFINSLNNDELTRAHFQ